MINRTFSIWIFAVISYFFIVTPAKAAPSCGEIFVDLSPLGQSSLAELVDIMNEGPYSIDQLPIIPLNLTRFGPSNFLVRDRSADILVNKRDYRWVGQPKPIHPMGIGLIGTLETGATRWSGIFSGGRFLVAARASISQANPYKIDKNERPQERSTAFAIKIFDTMNPPQRVKTANAVFQNDLIGLLNKEGQAISFLDSIQTNHPPLNFLKVRRMDQIITLVGLGLATIKNKLERVSQKGSFPFNPQIRPVHSWAELGVLDPQGVKVPTWVQLVPRVPNGPIERSDFRREIYDTLRVDGLIRYDLYAADAVNSKGQKNWEYAGTFEFKKAIVSSSVDTRLLFPHDTFNSPYTKAPFKIPRATEQFNQVPDDLQ